MTFYLQKQIGNIFNFENGKLYLKGHFPITQCGYICFTVKSYEVEEFVLQCTNIFLDSYIHITNVVTIISFEKSMM